MLIAEKKSRPALLRAGIAVVLAAGAAVVLQLSALARVAPEGVAEALWVTGWALVVWSAVSVLSTIVALVRRRGGESALASAVLVGAAVTLLALTAMLHPFVGAAGGTA